MLIPKRHTTCESGLCSKQDRGMSVKRLSDRPSVPVGVPSTVKIEVLVLSAEALRLPGNTCNVNWRLNKPPPASGSTAV